MATGFLKKIKKILTKHKNRSILKKRFLHRNLGWIKDCPAVLTLGGEIPFAEESPIL